MKCKSPVVLLRAVLLTVVGFNADAAAVSGQGSWETTLQARYFDPGPTADGYYDTVLDITWLADANYPLTSRYDPGYPSDRPAWILSWPDANAFVESLSFGSGIDGWRLPVANPINGSAYGQTQSFDGTTDFGFNISAPGTPYAGSGASELAHMYYNTLGNLGFYSISGSPFQPGRGLTNTGPIKNLLPVRYWTGSQYVSQPARPDWYIGLQFTNGEQYLGGGEAFVWPVHDGDVGDTEHTLIPEPGTFALFGLGLAGLGLYRRRREA